MWKLDSGRDAVRQKHCLEHNLFIVSEKLTGINTCEANLTTLEQKRNPKVNSKN